MCGKCTVAGSASIPGIEVSGYLAFIARYNRTAEPFNWKYTSDDLASTLRRISEHDQISQTPAELPEAA